MNTAAPSLAPVPRAHVETDVGKVRERNEDAWLIDDDLGLYIVADGMGGHAGGAEASAACVRALRESLYRQLADGHTSARAAPGRLTRAVEHANSTVLKLGRDDPELAGCGTTVTGILFIADLAWVCHVGDSRCYHQREGELWLVTSDHTVAAERVRTGLDRAEDVAEEDHVLMRAVGTDHTVQVDVMRVPTRPGDKFLLCSDGLTEHLKPREIREILSLADPEAAARACVGTTLDRGAVDNVTVLVVEV